MGYALSKVSRLFNPGAAAMTNTDIYAPSQPLQVMVSVQCSSSEFWIHGDEPFSITLSAHVADTNDQPLTIYAKETLLHPRSPVLERHGLVFSNATTGEAAERLLIDVLRVYPEGGIPVARATQEAFIEIPSDPARPYKVTFNFEPERNFLGFGHRKGLLPGQQYEIGLGSIMSVVKWCKVGAKAAVLAQGERNGERVKRMEGHAQVKMVLANQYSFYVRDGRKPG